MSHTEIWEYNRCSESDHYRITSKGDSKYHSKIIAIIQNEEDADHIVKMHNSFPDLFEALKDLLDYKEGGEWESLIRNAVLAIAKAE